MNEHGVSSFTDPLCCSNPNGCSKTVAVGSSPWDVTVPAYHHIDIENYVDTSSTPNALFSKTKYNMRVRSICGTLQSGWTPADNDWLGCTVLGFCYGTGDTTCSNLVKTGTPSSESVQFGPPGSCSVSVAPYAQKTGAPIGAYGNTFVSTSGVLTVKKFEFDDQDGGSCDIDYGFTNSWSKPQTDWLDVHAKVYRKDGGSNQQEIGFRVWTISSNCGIRKWNGVTSTWGDCLSTTDLSKLSPNAVPGNDIGSTYNIEYCGDGTVTSGLAGCTASGVNEICDPPGSWRGTCSVGNTRTEDQCNSACTGNADTNSCESDCGAEVACDEKNIGDLCITGNGDNGTCTSLCECRASCTRNADCGAGRCCLGHTAPPEAAGPLYGTGDRAAATCVSKQVYAANSAYLCDPGTWIVCDESKVGIKKEFDNRVFVCIKENETYKWIETTATQLPQPTKSEEFVIDLPNIFSEIIKLFAMMFVL